MTVIRMLEQSSLWLGAVKDIDKVSGHLEPEKAIVPVQQR